MRKLTRQETMELVVHFQRTGCNETAERLIKENTNLMRKVVKRFSPTLGVDDMMQQAMWGFYDGLKKFDVERGLALSTFMYPQIYGYVQRWARDFQTVKTNRMTLEYHGKAKRIIEEYYNAYGEHISSHDLATHLGVPNWRAIEIIDTLSHYTYSLDAPNNQDEGETTYLDVLANNDTSLDIESVQLRLALQELSERERTIIKRYYFDGFSQLDIANELGITQTAISRILKKTHQKLYELLQVS